jgi:hypothetical protein
MSVSCEAPGCPETALEPGCDAHDTYDGHDEHFWCAEQCPACDGSGWILDCDACRESGKSLADTDCSASGCRVCKRTGSCQPIPVKGKQGVWEWKEGTRG